MMSEKKQIVTMQALIVFFIVVSVVTRAMNPPTFIAQLMGISWGALAGAFLAPFLYGLYWKRRHQSGGVGQLYLREWASRCPTCSSASSNLAINAGAVAMVAGLVVVPVVSLVTPKPDQKKMGELFSCYEEKVTITKKRSLETKY